MSAPPLRPSRRAFLSGALALPLASACTGSDEPGAMPTADPDAGFRDAAVAREQALLRAYDALLAARPELLPRLDPVRREHLAHLDALGAGVHASAQPSQSAPTLRALAAAEAAAGAGHARDAVVASRALAPLLASLAASEASHRVSLQ